MSAFLRRMRVLSDDDAREIERIVRRNIAAACCACGEDIHTGGAAQVQLTWVNGSRPFAVAVCHRCHGQMVATQAIAQAEAGDDEKGTAAVMDRLAAVVGIDRAPPDPEKMS